MVISFVQFLRKQYTAFALGRQFFPFGQYFVKILGTCKGAWKKGIYYIIIFVSLQLFRSITWYGTNREETRGQYPLLLLLYWHAVQYCAFFMYSKTCHI